MDPVPDVPDHLLTLSGRVWQVPDLVALTGINNTRITAAHGDHTSEAYDVVGEGLGVVPGQVQAHLRHHATTAGSSSAAGSGPAERTLVLPSAATASRAAVIWGRQAFCTDEQHLGHLGGESCLGLSQGVEPVVGEVLRGGLANRARAVKRFHSEQNFLGVTASINGRAPVSMVTGADDCLRSRPVVRLKAVRLSHLSRRDGMHRIR